MTCAGSGIRDEQRLGLAPYGRVGMSLEMSSGSSSERKELQREERDVIMRRVNTRSSLPLPSGWPRSSSSAGISSSPTVKVTQEATLLYLSIMRPVTLLLIARKRLDAPGGERARRRLNFATAVTDTQ